MTQIEKRTLFVDSVKKLADEIFTEEKPVVDVEKAKEGLAMLAGAFGLAVIEATVAGQDSNADAGMAGEEEKQEGPKVTIFS